MRLSAKCHDRAARCNDFNSIGRKSIPFLRRIERLAGQIYVALVIELHKIAPSPRISRFQRFRAPIATLKGMASRRWANIARFPIFWKELSTKNASVTRDQAGKSSESSCKRLKPVVF
jgi:hypothetical protein